MFLFLDKTGHPVGQKSISVSTSVYDTVIKPFSPLLAKANTFASPIVTKADHLADSGLLKLEQSVPLVKEPTEKLKARVTSLPAYALAQDALSFGSETTGYALRVYNEEYNKSSNGEKASILSAAKAGVSTTFILSSQSAAWITAFIRSRAETTTKQAGEDKPPIQE